ncbi:ribbon-helix-helix domain-containing protein [Lichenibacterium ramalinae]|uniref:Type II toxin-antitoxin system ParD family antitoxin n=1 Tax=Lichenibacterium ramalinae TaxID=2316527 RepID=A0A4Q2R538_9HYPH|nr:type II toxin-antitoxin system ParD family antitoxin [Lichenibacterium ramalinae]RYB01666.1 type II toxin-antitoxin system ParD family antitoxin [Lichenibacterium ramalinae]
MAAKHSLHVALTEPLVRHVRDQIATGRYTTASEVLRKALQLMIERDAGRPAGKSNAQQSVSGHD